MILRLMLTLCCIVFPCKLLMAKQIMDNAIMIVKIVMINPLILAKLLYHVLMKK